MAWGYKVPNFNTWGRYYYWEQEVTRWVGPYYFRGQLRTGDRTGHGFSREIAVPKGLAARPRVNVLGDRGDIIQMAGWGTTFAFVDQVEDSGAGFPNEHRIITVLYMTTEPYDTEVTPTTEPVVNVLLEPPEGAEMMPVNEPWAMWLDPLGVPSGPP